MISPRYSCSEFSPAKKLLLFFAALCAFVLTARAQFTYSEDFKNSTAPGWVLNPAGNSTPNAILTSGAAPRTGDPEFGSSTIDPSGAGWLRLTNNTLNTHNAVYFDTPIPSAGNAVTITFGMNQFFGNNFNSTGADGITFFLYDGSKNFQVGADGGSIGYAQKTGVDGLNGGFVAVALDAYGNFSVNAEGRIGGTAALLPNSVAVRGPGQGQTGYNFLAATGNFDYTDSGIATVKDGTDGAVPALPYTMAFPTATSRPNQSTDYRNVSITINENSQLSVSMQFGEDGLWYQLLNVDLSSFVRPEQLKLGFSAGTGSGTSVTEVGGLLTIQATAGTGNFIWDNQRGPSDSGTGNSVWGTGATDPLNWAGQTNPTLKSNVIFNSTYINSTQNISVNGNDKVITNMYFSGPNSYNLSTTEARKLIFDSATSLTSINLTNDASGNAAHSIALDLQMNKNLDINNNINPTFTVTGNIDTGGNVLGLKGTGTTVLAGAISGTGSLVKSDAGKTILNGSSANTYTGTTTVSGGTLQIEKATALGATGAGSETSVASGATLALGGTGTTFAAETLSISGTGVSNAGALRNIAGVNTWTGTVSLDGTGSNNIGVDAGSLNLSGVISGAAGNDLNKVGTGILTLSGSNTYNGNTTVSAGILAISSDSNLGTAPGAATAGKLNLNGGTLETTTTMTINGNRGISLGAAGGTFQTDSGTTLTYNGIATGTGALTKTGTGTMVVGGVNTYTGATTINQGTLQLGANSALSGSTAVTVASGATFDVNSKTDTIGSLAGAGTVTLGSGTLTTGNDNTSTTFSGNATGTGGLTKIGNGVLTLTGSNSYTGATTIGNGTANSSNILRIGASNTLAATSPVAFAGGTLSVGGAYNLTAGAATLSANSNIDFAGNNSILTFASLTRSAGTLTIDNWAGSAFGGGNSRLITTAAPTGFTGTGGVLNEISFTGWGSGSIRLASGEIVPNGGGTIYTYVSNGTNTWNTTANWTNNASGTFAQNAGDTAVLGSAISTPTTITLNGADRTLGYMVVNNANKYTISGNNLIFDVKTGIAGQAQLVNQGAGGVDISSGIKLADALTVTQAGTGAMNLSGTITNSAGTNNLVFTGDGTGVITVSGNITTGAGTLTKSGNSTLVLSGAGNTFTGATTVNGGTVSIAADTGLGSIGATVLPAQLTLNGGTLQSTATMTLAGNRGVTIGAGGGTFNTNSATTLTYGGIIAGTAAGNASSLTKSGSGTLILSGANTYNGNTTIAGGTLQLGSGTSIPDASAVSLTGASTTFSLNNNSETIGSLASAQTTSVLSLGSGTLTTGGNNAGTQFDGTITGTGGLTKTGTGTMTLTGNSTYTGATNVNAGTLNIQSNNALGTIGGVTVVGNAAALEVQGGIATAEAINIRGSGYLGNGSIRNVSGNNTLSGAITLTGGTDPLLIKSESGTLTLSGGISSTGGSRIMQFGGAGNVTVSSTMNLDGSGTTGTLTKNDSGYLTLTSAGTYSGGTTINAGTLEIQNGGALGTGAATVVSGSTLALSGNITVGDALAIAGTGAGNLGAIRNISGTNTLTGTIALGVASYVGVEGNSTLTTTGLISGSNDLTKIGTGTLVLNGSVANTYTGTTAVTAGTLEIDQAGQLGTNPGVTTVSSGATLRINATGATVGEYVTLAGSGVGNLGALQNSGGNNTWTGNLTMNADSAIGAASGTTLTATGVISNAINNSYNLTKVGAGTLVLSGVNTYSGTTTVRNGTLSVNSNAPVSNNGALGNSGSTIQVGDSGTAATDNLGLIIGPAGNLTLDRAVSINNYNTSGTVTMGGSNSTGTNSFTGNIGLGRDVNVTSVSGGNVSFTGDVSGSGNVTVNGTGNVTFSGSNSYTGNTTVNSGATLIAASANALGNTGNASVTTVNSGGTLGFQGGITVPSLESYSVAGTGVGGAGAINNVSGANTVTGNIAMTSSASFGASSGSLNLSGIVSGTGNTFTKVGAGEVVLSGTSANTYTGGTTVSAGTLTLNKTSGVDATGPSGTITVNSGGTVALGADNQINNSVTLNLNGGSFRTNNNSDVIGNLNLTTSSTINFGNGDSTSLTFTNATRSNGTVLTIDDWNGIPTVGGGGSQLLFTNAGTNFVNQTDIAFTGFGAGWTRLASGEIVPISLTGTTYTWKTNANANWATGNFNPAGAPSVANDTAVFSTGTLTASRIVTLAGNTTLGYLAFNGTNASQYTIAAGNLLNFDVTAGNAQIQVDDTAAPTINANISLSDKLNISSSSTGTLTVGGNIMSAGNTTMDLSINGSGTVALNGVIGGAVAGSTGNIGNITKAGNSTLILAGANTYTGNTTVNNGTLQLNASAPSGAAGTLGNSTTTVVLGTSSSPSDATISLLTNGNGVDVGRNIQVGAFGNTTTIGGLNTTGTSTYSGTINLDKTTSFTAAAGGTVAFTGALTGTGGFTKVGNGTVTLGGAGNNTLTGNFDVQAGTLQIAKTTGGVDQIGPIQGAIGDLASVTLSGSSSTLAFSASGVYTLEEIGSLSGVSGSKVDVNTASAFTLYTGNNNLNTTMAGNITNSGGGALSLVKQGTGSMTLSGANTYAGNTTVSAGTLIAANNTALGGTGATATTTVLGNATLGLSGGITVTGEQLALAAITAPNIASLANLSGNNTWAGTVSMTGTTAHDAVKFDATGSTTLTISGVVSEATNDKVFAKTGTGTLVLSGVNTYTGDTNIIAGTLTAANNNALGAGSSVVGNVTVGNTAVQIGATLGVQGNITIAATEGYTLNGSANPPSAPSIKNIAGTNTLAGNVLLSGGINTGVAINSDTGTSLTLNGAITQATNPNFIIKTGAGDLTLGGGSSNTFSGGLTINDGKVIAAKTAGDATGAGNVTIGTGLSTATLQLNASNQINDSSNVTIAPLGKLDLQGNSDTIGALTMGGGSVTSTAGNVTLGGNLTFNGVGANTATITGNINLGTGTRIVQIGNNGSNADVDLSINGVVGGVGLNKTDLGVLELKGGTANTLTGGFQVSDGTVLLNKTGDLNATTGTGTSVVVGDSVNAAKTAILKLGQNNQILDTATVTVNSDGQFNVNGMLETIGAIAGSGNIETGAGTLTIAGNNSVSTFSGTLTDATGTVFGGNVTVVGSGRVILDMDQDNSGTKLVAGGSMTFNSNIDFAGTLELKSGTLFLPGVNLNVGTLYISGTTFLDFGNSAASTLNATNIILAPGANLTITNWVSNVDFFFAQNWLNGGTGSVVPGLNTRGTGDETKITFDGFSSSQTAWLDYAGGTKHQITPAPEPATYGAIFTGAALALLGYRRWRKTAVAAKAA